MASITSTPIASRPKPDWLAQLRFIGFNVFFAGFMVLMHLFQLLAALLWLVEPLRPLKDKAIAFTKGQFGLLCVFITQWFAPTNFILTVEEDVDINTIVTPMGPTKLHLPARSGMFSLRLLPYA